MSYRIFCVESQKGGVGKTTIALNIGKALVDKGYDVLLIDCDITGTDITEAASHSPFWNNYVANAFVDNNLCNLLQYFEKDYLAGGNINNFLFKKLSFNSGRISLLGSDLYDKNGGLILDPRLLMDDLHSEWFVEFIKEIVKQFVGKTKKEKKAIVLDTSPGFVGIGKAIRDWLTSIGSEFAHFVLVSSLDEQDVESTIKSAMDIKKYMSLKWKIAHQYKLMEGKKVGFDELNTILTDHKELSEFYYSLYDDPYPSSLVKEPQISDFISIILNKVPTRYVDSRMRDRESSDLQDVVKALFPQDSNGRFLNLIEFDVSISGQFIEANILKPTQEEKNRINIDSAFAGFTRKIGKYVESDDKVRQASSLKKSFMLLQKQLNGLGYGKLVDSLGFDLSSDQYIQDLIMYVKSFGNVVIPKVDGMNVQNEIIQSSDKELVRLFIENNNLAEYSSVFYSVFETLYKKVGFKNKRYNKHLIVIVSLFLRVFLIILEDYYKKNKISFHLALMQSYNDQSICKERLSMVQNSTYKISDIDSIIAEGPVYNLFLSRFAGFYQKMCYTLLRLIDCEEDFSIVASALRESIQRDGWDLYPDLRQYLRAVMIRKTVEFKHDVYNDLIKNPYEMQVIRKVISDVILNKFPR